MAAGSEPLPTEPAGLPPEQAGLPPHTHLAGPGSDPSSAAGSPRAVPLARTLTPNQLQRVQMLAQVTADVQAGAAGALPGGDPESLLRVSQGNLRTSSSVAARSLETEAMLQAAAYSNAAPLVGGLSAQHPHLRRGGPGGLPPLAYHPPYLSHPAVAPAQGASGLLGNPAAYAEALAALTANMEVALLAQAGGQHSPALAAQAQQLAQQQLAQQMAAEQLASHQLALQLAGVPTSSLPGTLGSMYMPLQSVGRSSVGLPFPQPGAPATSMEGSIAAPPPPGPPSLHAELSLMHHPSSGMPSGGSIVSNMSSRLEPSVVGSPKQKSPPAAASPKPPLPKVLSAGKLSESQVRTQPCTRWVLMCSWR